MVARTRNDAKGLSGAHVTSVTSGACAHRHAPYSPTIDSRVCLACHKVLPALVNKYHANRTAWNDLTFDSAAECDYYKILFYREDTGAIQDLRVKPRFDLSANGVHICTYVADFSFVEVGTLVVVDVKGYRTPVYKLKRALMRALLGIEIREVQA